VSMTCKVSLDVISGWQTGEEFAVLEPQALAKHAESLLDSRSCKEKWPSWYVSHTPTLFTAPASWLGFPHEFYAAKCISNAVMMEEEDLWCDWETILPTQKTNHHAAAASTSCQASLWQSEVRSSA
jgi:hypothetical protein